jgi:hypothetical protein
VKLQEDEFGSEPSWCDGYTKLDNIRSGTKAPVFAMGTLVHISEHK